MLMTSSLNGCAFSCIAVVNEAGETLGCAFNLLDAGKVATALAFGQVCHFVPVFSDTWHYDMKHAVCVR